jgi:hypothetical protein
MSNSVAKAYLIGFHEKEAREHLKRAVEWEKLADHARSAEVRQKHREKARKERDEAINCIENANRGAL